MKFRRPTQNPVTGSQSRGSFVGVPNQRPEWFRDWIANKNRWVLLACGHKVDLNWNGQTTLEGLEGEKKGSILTNCEPCGQFIAVKRKLSLTQFAGISTAVIPAEPLF